MSKWFGVAMGVIFTLLFGLVAVGPAMADGISTTQDADNNSQIQTLEQQIDSAGQPWVSWAWLSNICNHLEQIRRRLYSANHYKRHRRPTDSPWRRRFKTVTGLLPTPCSATFKQ